MDEAAELSEDILEEAEHLAHLEPEDDGKESTTSTHHGSVLAAQHQSTPSLCQVHSFKSPTS